MLSRVQLFATPWTVAHQAPLSVKFSRQEYWMGQCLTQKAVQYGVSITFTITITIVLLKTL